MNKTTAGLLILAVVVVVLYFWGLYALVTWVFSNQSAEAIGGWWKTLTEAAK